MTKSERTESAIRRTSLTKVCTLAYDIIGRIRDESRQYPKSVYQQTDKVERWIAECLRLSGIQSRRDLSAGLLRDYQGLAMQINTELGKHDMSKNPRRVDGAMCVVVDNLICGVRAVIDEYRHARPVVYLDKAFERLMWLVLDGDEEAEDVGSEIYMIVG